MTTHGTIRTCVLAVVSVLLLGACEKPGPAEKAGKAIDEAASEISDKAKDAEKAIEEKLED